MPETPHSYTVPLGRGVYSFVWDQFTEDATRLIFKTQACSSDAPSADMSAAPTAATTAAPSAAPTDAAALPPKCTGAQCIQLKKDSFGVGEPIELSWTGASETNKKWMVAVTKEGKDPKGKKVMLSLKTCGGGKACKGGKEPRAEGTLTMDEGKPKEGGRLEFPLPSGSYEAHLAHKGTSKSGGFPFAIINPFATSIRNADERL